MYLYGMDTYNKSGFILYNYLYLITYMQSTINEDYKKIVQLFIYETTAEILN